jgi:hypothetical protein
MNCDNCGETIKLGRKANQTLIVGCDCNARSIRVATVLPDGWSE